MDFRDLLDLCQSEALANRFSPTEKSIWESHCRTYSKKFHTPLSQVLEMTPEHVMSNVYEDQLSDIDPEEKIEDLLDWIYALEDPSYERKKEEDLDEFVKKAEREEEQRLTSGTAIHSSIKEVSNRKIDSDQKDIENSILPTEGSLDLSYLEKEESNPRN